LYRHIRSVQDVRPIEEVEVWLYSFLITALEGYEGSASSTGRSLPPGKTRHPLYRRLGGPKVRSGQVLKISPASGFDPWTVKTVASRYTNWATRPTCYCRSDWKQFTKNCNWITIEKLSFRVMNMLLWPSIIIIIIIIVIMLYCPSIISSYKAVKISLFVTCFCRFKWTELVTRAFQLLAGSCS